jgi:hypothetical protein
MTEPDYEQLECVRLSGEGAAEMDQHRRIIFVPRADITRLELQYGPGAERPLVMLILGLLCAALAVGSLLWIVLLFLRPGGPRTPIELITGVAFLAPAWWLLDLSLRKRWFVRVHTRSGSSRKLIFHETKDRTAIETFLTSARGRFGYS